MSTFHYQSICNASEFNQVDTLPYNFYDYTLFSKTEQNILSSVPLEQFSLASWDRQQYDQVNLPNFLFSDLSLPVYDSPEHALNTLLQEHHTLAPPQPGFDFLSPSLSADTNLVKPVPLSPASINSFDSCDYGVSDNSVICFSQLGNYSDDHQMPHIYEYEPETQPIVMGSLKQNPLSNQPSYLHYQPNYVLTPKEQAFLPIERQVQKKSRRRTHPSQLQCTLCFKTFSRPYNLKSHQRTHTKERPYRCTHPNCGWTFARPHDLKRHEFLHSGIKPHVCSCGKKFSRSDAFKRHQTVDTGCASQKKKKSKDSSSQQQAL